MPARLQIETSIDANRDGKYDAVLTPFDIPLPDGVSSAIETAIIAADQFDDEPGDGEFDKKFKSKFPIKINLWIAQINQTIEVWGKQTIRVKH